jgi:HEAT repeat protein
LASIVTSVASKLKHTDVFVKASACKALGAIAGSSTSINGHAHSGAGAGASAGRAAGDYATEIAQALRDSNKNVQEAACKALRSMGERGGAQARGVAALLTATTTSTGGGSGGSDGGSGSGGSDGSDSDPRHRLRYVACMALRAMAMGGSAGAREQARAVADLLRPADPDLDVRVAACAALGAMGEAGAVHADAVARWLEHPEGRSLAPPQQDAATNVSHAKMRRAACKALAEMGPAAKMHFATLVEIRNMDEDAAVREAATEALENLGMGM